jgi:hypothetical protein
MALVVHRLVASGSAMIWPVNLDLFVQCGNSGQH